MRMMSSVLCPRSSALFPPPPSSLIPHPSQPFPPSISLRNPGPSFAAKIAIPMPDQEPQPHSELASFGEELRREREIRGISLKEIADATKISKRFLEAIERNDHRTLPAPVFTRGFVRQYARYRGRSAEEMVNRYNFAAVGDDRIEQLAHLERPTTTEAPPP